MRQLIEAFPLPIFSVISTLIFVGMFLGIIYWTFNVQSRDAMDERARLPFKDSEELASKPGVQK